MYTWKPRLLRGGIKVEAIVSRGPAKLCITAMFHICKTTGGTRHSFFFWGGGGANRWEVTQSSR